jgi:pimeloyl-ACP methyl ester carboxylesterase
MPDKQPLRFTIENTSRPGEKISIAGWDYGGTGKPIALLHHANGFCGGTWELVARRLINHYNVIAIDARGHGDSYAGDVPADYDWDFFVDDLLAVAKILLKQSQYKNIDLGIGSSFGGIITAAAEAKQPGLFKRIALLDPPIHPTPLLVERFHLDIEPVNPVKSVLVAQTLKRRTHWPSLDEPRTSWRHKGMFANWSDEAFELYLAECLKVAQDGSVSLKCDPEVEAHIFETTGSLDVMQYAPFVEIPVLYARAQTGHVPAEFCKELAGLFKYGQYEEIRGGHILPLENPALVVDRLLSFTSKTDKSGEE